MLQNSSLPDPAGDRSFQEKIRLTRQLKDKRPQYIEILGIFELVLEERKKYRSALGDLPNPKIFSEPLRHASRLEKGLPLLERNDIDFNNQIMAEHLVRLLQIIKSKTQKKSGRSPDAVRSKKNLNLKKLFTLKAMAGEALVSDPISADLMDFLVSETFNPVLALYAEKLKDQINFAGWDRGYCPVCGEVPAMAALNEGTGKRQLISLACGTEWEFSRVKCPCCENEDQRQLSYLCIENESRYRIETCDRCRHYLKTVDLRHSILPVDYEVENIVTLHLDIIARENGYVNDGSGRTSRPANGVYH